MVPNFKIQPNNNPLLLQKFIDDIHHNSTPCINFIFLKPNKQNATGFTMSVKGSKFIYVSKVITNGKAKATTLINDNILQVKFSESDILDDDEYEIILYSLILNGRISNPKKFVVNSSSFSLWEWITTGAVAIFLAFTAIYLLEPDPFPKHIAEPPGRP